MDWSVVGAGCYVDSHWGQFGPDRLVELCFDWGFRAAPEDVVLLVLSRVRLSESGPYRSDFEFGLLVDWLVTCDVFSDPADVWDWLSEFYDRVLAWLNGRLAEAAVVAGVGEDDRLYADWTDGDLMIQPLSWWADDWGFGED